MRHIVSSGTKMKLKKISEQEEILSSLEQTNKESSQPQDQCITFEDAKDAVNILIAQCGSPSVRKAHRGRIMGYLILQERRLRTLERRAKNWGYEDEIEHCLALARAWDAVE